MPNIEFPTISYKICFFSIRIAQYNSRHFYTLPHSR